MAKTYALLPSLCALSLTVACFEDPAATGSDSADTTGDGDGDPGDGDGDPGDGDGDPGDGDGDPGDGDGDPGDGDGDPGDGDGDPGDGDGDGDGDPQPVCGDGQLTGNEVCYDEPTVVQVPLANAQGAGIADLDNDGHLDVVFSSFTASAISLLGDGTGSFASPNAINLGANAGVVRIALAPIADNVPDLVAADLVNGQMVRVRGDGDGTFASPGNFPGARWDVALADMNGDNRLDMAYTLMNPEGVGVRLGTAAESFGNALTVSYNFADPFDVAVGDVTGDDQPDVVVGDSGADQVVVFSGNGTGNLTFAQTIATENGPSSVALGDLDGDGDLDVIVGAGPVVQVFGSPNFALADETTVVGGVLSTAVVDIDGDGNLDVVTLDSGQTPALSLMLGNGDLTLQDQIVINLPDMIYPYDLAVGDLNEDGAPDFAVAAAGQSPFSVIVLSGA